MTETPAHLVSICLLDESGDVLVEEYADEVHYAASVMKLGVLVAAHRALASDPAQRSATFDPGREVRSPVSGEPVVIDEEDRDHDLLAMGQVGLATLARRAITVSSNTATNVLLDILGIEACDRPWRDAGAEGCRVARLLWDFQAGEARNTITARGAARMMHAIHAGALADAESTDAMVSVLRAQTHREMIQSVCPPGSIVGNKDGDVTGVRHDVAHISVDGRSCTLAVLTTTELDIHQAEALIRREAKRVLADWRPDR